MTVEVVTRPEADVQILRALEWWLAHRPESPSLFLDELQACRDNLAANPEIGVRIRHRRIPGLRRLLLPSSRYHVYYVLRPSSGDVVVLALWSALRGRKPRMAPP
jgi:plasmid stabilization system protein ParE